MIFGYTHHNHHPTDPTDPGALINVSVVRAVVAIDPQIIPSSHFPTIINSFFLLQNIIIFIAVKSCEHKNTHIHTHRIVCKEEATQKKTIILPFHPLTILWLITNNGWCFYFHKDMFYVESESIWYTSI